MSDPALIRIDIYAIDQDCDAQVLVQSLVKQTRDGDGAVDFSVVTGSGGTMEPCEVEDLTCAVGPSRTLEESSFYGAGDWMEELGDEVRFRTVQVRFWSRGLMGAEGFSQFLLPALRDEPLFACSLYAASEDFRIIFAQDYFGGEVVEDFWPDESQFDEFFSKWFGSLPADFVSSESETVTSEKVTKKKAAKKKVAKKTAKKKVAKKTAKKKRR